MDISDELQAQLWVPQKLHGLFARVSRKHARCSEMIIWNLALKLGKQIQLPKDVVSGAGY